MRYSIIKFHSTYGGSFYQVRVFRGWLQTWLKDADRNVLTFPTHESARAHMHSLTDDVQATEPTLQPPAE